MNNDFHIANASVRENADITDATGDYVDIDVSFGFQSNPALAGTGNDVTGESHVGNASMEITNSPNPASFQATYNQSSGQDVIGFGNVDKRIDRLEKLTCTVFDDIR